MGKKKNQNGKKSVQQINAEIRQALEDGNKLSLMRMAAVTQGMDAHKESKKVDACPYRGAMSELDPWWRCGWLVQMILEEREASHE